MSHSRGCEQASTPEELFANSQTGLLFEDDQRGKPGIEVVNPRPVAIAGSGDHFLQDLRKCEASVEAV